MLDTTSLVLVRACENKLASKSTDPLTQHVACIIEKMFRGTYHLAIPQGVQKELIALGFNW